GAGGGGGGAREAAGRRRARGRRPLEAGAGRAAEGASGRSAMRLPRGRRARVVVIAALLTLCFLLLLGRAVDLAVLRGADLARQAARQHHEEVELVPHRGEIVDRNGDLLALSLDVPSIYVRPKELGDDRPRLADVARVLRVPMTRLQSRLATEPFVWLKRQALPRELSSVLDLRVGGVGHLDEPRTGYPHGDLAAHVLGVVGMDAQGLSGLARRVHRAVPGQPAVSPV